MVNLPAKPATLRSIGKIMLLGKRNSRAVNRKVIVIIAIFPGEAGPAAVMMPKKVAGNYEVCDF